MLVVGRKVLAMATAGAHACLLVQGMAMSVMELQGARCSFGVLPKEANASICMALLTAEVEDICKALRPWPWHGWHGGRATAFARLARDEVAPQVREENLPAD